MKSIILKFFLFTCFFSFICHSQENKNKPKYFVVLKDSIKIVGTIIEINHQSDTIRMLTDKGKEISFKYCDIYFQKQLRNESELEINETYESLDKMPIFDAYRWISGLSKSLYSKFSGFTKPYLITDYIFDQSDFNFIESKIFVNNQTGNNELTGGYFNFLQYNTNYRIQDRMNRSGQAFDIILGFNLFKYLSLQFGFELLPDVNLEYLYHWPNEIDFVSYHSRITLNVEKQNLTVSLKLSKKFIHKKFDLYSYGGLQHNQSNISLKLMHELFNSELMGGFRNDKIIVLDSHRLSSSDWAVGFGLAYYIFKNMAINADFKYLKSKNYTYKVNSNGNSILPVYRNGKLEAVKHTSYAREDSYFNYSISNSTSFLKLGFKFVL